MDTGAVLRIRYAAADHNEVRALVEYDSAVLTVRRRHFFKRKVRRVRRGSGDDKDLRLIARVDRNALAVVRFRRRFDFIFILVLVFRNEVSSAVALFNDEFAVFVRLVHDDELLLTVVDLLVRVRRNAVAQRVENEVAVRVGRVDRNRNHLRRIVEDGITLLIDLDARLNRLNRRRLDDLLAVLVDRVDRGAVFVEHDFRLLADVDFRRVDRHGVLNGQRLIRAVLLVELVDEIRVNVSVVRLLGVKRHALRLLRKVFGEIEGYGIAGRVGDFVELTEVGSIVVAVALGFGRVEGRRPAEVDFHRFAERNEAVVRIDDVVEGRNDNRRNFAPLTGVRFVRAEIDDSNLTRRASKVVRSVAVLFLNEVVVADVDRKVVPDETIVFLADEELGTVVDEVLFRSRLIAPVLVRGERVFGVNRRAVRDDGSVLEADDRIVERDLCAAFRLQIDLAVVYDRAIVDVDDRVAQRD